MHHAITWTNFDQNIPASAHEELTQWGLHKMGDILQIGFSNTFF